MTFTRFARHAATTTLFGGALVLSIATSPAEYPTLLAATDPEPISLQSAGDEDRRLIELTLDEGAHAIEGGANSTVALLVCALEADGTAVPDCYRPYVPQEELEVEPAEGDEDQPSEEEPMNEGPAEEEPAEEEPGEEEPGDDPLVDPEANLPDAIEVTLTRGDVTLTERVKLGGDVIYLNTEVLGDGLTEDQLEVVFHRVDDTAGPIELQWYLSASTSFPGLDADDWEQVEALSLTVSEKSLDAAGEEIADEQSSEEEPAGEQP